MQRLFCCACLIESRLMGRKDQTEFGQQPEVYEPPKVTRVTLRPEEAVLGHCKVTGSGGPVSSGCQPISNTVCNSPGS
jgi:hypothetical protein